MFEDFSAYEDCEPAGLELPQISLSESSLKELGLTESPSSKEILSRLIRLGIKTKGIDKLVNKQEYFDRAKQELDTFDELGFTDYILLNWDIVKFAKDCGIPVGEGYDIGCMKPEWAFPGSIPIDIDFDDEYHATNLVCYVYYFTGANGTLGTALAPAPTGFVPDDEGGVILNGGIYMFTDFVPITPVNYLQVAAKSSIYRYDSNTHATINFTLGTISTPLLGFIQNGTLYHTASFNGPTCPQSQSYIANSGKTAWIQIGDKSTGITYS